MPKLSKKFIKNFNEENNFLSDEEKTLKLDNILKIYSDRIEKVVEYLKENSVGAAVFIDNEKNPEPAVRYFSNHPTDAIFIIFSDGDFVLIPWDENLANKNYVFEKLEPFTKFENDNLKAVESVISKKNRMKNKVVEIPPATNYPDFLKFVEAIPDWDVRCIEDGVHKFVTESRMIKDSYEIECTEKACEIGDKIFEEIQEEVKNQNIKTETDVALFIEKRLRFYGCEKTGFDTLAAGPCRSWAIHCFPNYTENNWPDFGLSILDFGVIYKGYTSDQTITIAKGKLSAEQEEILNLVQEASEECLKLYMPGKSIKSAAEKANKIFEKAKRKMPHTLGHGIGLEIHEYPRVSSKLDEKIKFQPGMILTLEPGLYDENLGGCRLENDVLITETGNKVLTHSKILRIE